MHLRRLFHGHNPFHKPKNSQIEGTQPEEVEAQEDNTTNAILPTSPKSNVQPKQSTQSFTPGDLWQTAYNQLSDEERTILSAIHVSTDPDHKEDPPQTPVLISEIIRLTEEQYGNLQQRLDGKLRASSQHIINAALSFKDVISAVAASDPTHHAASAWAIVSLGLTIAQNRYDLRDALFESSEYLADVLTQCAYIEDKLYLKSNFGIKSDLGNAMVRLYCAILHYTAQIRIAQDPRVGRKLQDWVTTITDHPLTVLKISVEKERDNVFRWIGLVKFLHHEDEARETLSRIDQLAESMKHLIHQFGLVNLRVAEGALYDSYVNEHEDFCLPHTRTEILSRISEWAESPDGKCIFWLNGMAGTGKSTIARTVARSFKDKRQLGATFFFKRGEADRDNARYLISTITRQLVTKHRQLVPDVLNAIEEDPNISSKYLSEQFDKLLLQPLLRLSPDRLTTTVIVIDALDECDREDDIRVIVQLLLRLQETKSVCLRIFLTSRPELPIRLGFRQSTNHQTVVLHEFQKPVIKDDIRLFLKHKLSIIREQRSISPDWPGDDDIERLVNMAVPLFIFAATLCRFVGDIDWRPERRLRAILKDEATSSTSDMKRTYEPILNQLVESKNKSDSKQLFQEFHDIIGVIILLASPLSVISLAQLTGMSKDDISNRLNRFHSVLNVPDDLDVPVRILHVSFRDYLLTKDCRFYVDEKETHKRIFFHCLRIMNTSLKYNICGLPSYGTQMTNMNSQFINKHLSADLRYSCRYWVYHLTHSNSCTTEPMVFDFLEKHFLHWLEALSLMGVISEAVAMIDALQSGDRKTTENVSDFLYDAKRFILKNSYIARLAPLQLYNSGLVFSAMQSTIRKKFFDSKPKHIRTLPRVEDYWSPGLQTLEGHSDSVNSVAFSHDGQMVASGSNDTTIRLWDARAGSGLQTLKGHSHSIQSVAFSCNSQMIVSGSHDKTIILWDVMTGSEMQTLKGHSDSVNSVAFSHDGQMVASGSNDKTIKLWDVKTGSELHTLMGHSYSVRSVAFSYNSQIVASGSNDNTIKLWNVMTGSEIRTLKGHSHSVQSVAFSHDGQMVASGSNDYTIKLWDAKTGFQLQTLKGHSSSVWSVAFSHDNQMVASGSNDKTIKLWDAKAGSELQTLKGHSDWVRSVAFSHDGQMVASGSNDYTIKLWYTKTESEVQTLKGHSDWVRSVAFSYDGQMVASGSDDYTIKLWDAKTGSELQTLKGHSDLVWSVAFSNNNQMVASGSNDNTIRLWDAKTGSQLHMLKGHSSSVWSVAFSHDGQTVASGSHDKTVRIWDAITSSKLQTLKGHLDLVWSVAFSHDGQMVASGSSDTTIKLWDVKTGSELRTLKGHSYSVRSVAFSYNGQIVASGSNDYTIKLWDTNTGSELKTLEGHSHSIQSLAFSYDGQIVASGSSDYTIKLWDTNNGSELQALKRHSSSVHSIAPSSSVASTLHAEVHCDSYETSSHNLNFQASVSDNWVMLGGENTLWLPPEHRQFTASAVKEATLALGYNDGRVLIIGFSTL